MKTNQGTPTSIFQAIQNGIEHAGAQPAPTQVLAATIIEAHVLDFLRQKFGAAYLRADSGLCLSVMRELAMVLGVEVIPVMSSDQTGQSSGAV